MGGKVIAEMMMGSRGKKEAFVKGQEGMGEVVP